MAVPFQQKELTMEQPTADPNITDAKSRRGFPVAMSLMSTSAVERGFIKLAAVLLG